MESSAARRSPLQRSAGGGSPSPGVYPYREAFSLGTRRGSSSEEASDKAFRPFTRRPFTGGIIFRPFFTRKNIPTLFLQWENVLTFWFSGLIYSALRKSWNLSLEEA